MPMQSLLVAAFTLSLATAQGSYAVGGALNPLIRDTSGDTQVVRVLSNELGAASTLSGIHSWGRILALTQAEDFDRSAQTFFVPSDAAFRESYEANLAELLAPAHESKRRDFLASTATESRITPRDVMGKRTSVRLLSDRTLSIDDTRGELMVGEAEVLEIRMLPDGRFLFVLDQPLAP